MNQLLPKATKIQQHCQINQEDRTNADVHSRNVAPGGRKGWRCLHLGPLHPCSSPEAHSRGKPVTAQTLEELGSVENPSQDAVHMWTGHGAPGKGPSPGTITVGCRRDRGSCPKAVITIEANEPDQTRWPPGTLKNLGDSQGPGRRHV